MQRYWFGAVALVIVMAFVGFGYADKTRLHWVAEDSPAASQVAPDRVVGIEWRCTVYWPDRTVDVRGAEGCAAREGGLSDIYKSSPSDTSRLVNRRKEITVRTPMGTNYTVNVPPDTKVAVNDEWPPK
jgi:hypothetical protein